jgi:hypothetical protein
LSENEVKKCPKCGGAMEIGHLPNAWNWIEGKSRWSISLGRRIYGYGCRNCGYVEFYLERHQGQKRE